MLAQPLIIILEKLLKLHKSLYQLAVEKKEALLTGDMSALQFIMKSEQTHISAIQVVDKEREKIISDLIPNLQVPPILQDCLHLFEEDDQKKVIVIQKSLAEQLLELKALNELNQQLLEQSIQFVSLNLDLLLPESPTNYSKEEEDKKPSFSLFDSRA